MLILTVRCNYCICFILLFFFLFYSLRLSSQKRDFNGTISAFCSSLVIHTNKDKMCLCPAGALCPANRHLFRHWGKNNTDSVSLEGQRQGEYQWGQRRKSAGCQTLRSLLWTYHWMYWMGQSYLKGDNACAHKYKTHTHTKKKPHKQQIHNHTQTNGNRKHKYKWVWIID